MEGKPIPIHPKKEVAESELGGKGFRHSERGGFSSSLRGGVNFVLEEVESSVSAGERKTFPCAFLNSLEKKRKKNADLL